VVAFNAWIRGSTGEVIIDEIVDNSLKITLQIECVERNFHVQRYTSRVSRIGGGAAPLFVIGTLLMQATRLRSRVLLDDGEGILRLLSC
jgi:hypothetical protein